MPLVTVVIILAVVGVLLWLVNRIPMQGTIKSILNLVVVIAVVLWLLKVFDLFYDQVRQFLNVYLNEEDIRFLGGESCSLKDGDCVLLVPSIAGG